ncbi:hypothetical protein HBB16_16210 [Pseudonocardia sp. MCCB 268]|nr:hypothetical protein [Pseudonocardia cytotoxica]
MFEDETATPPLQPGGLREGEHDDQRLDQQDVFTVPQGQASPSWPLGVRATCRSRSRSRCAARRTAGSSGSIARDLVIEPHHRDRHRTSGWHPPGRRPTSSRIESRSDGGSAVLEVDRTCWPSSSTRRSRSSTWVRRTTTSTWTPPIAPG